MIEPSIKLNDFSIIFQTIISHILLEIEAVQRTEKYNI